MAEIYGGWDDAGTDAYLTGAAVGGTRGELGDYTHVVLPYITASVDNLDTFTINDAPDLLIARCAWEKQSASEANISVSHTPGQEGRQLVFVAGAPGNGWLHLWLTA